MKVHECLVLVTCVIAAAASMYNSIQIQRGTPYTAEETLRRENLLNSKREAYYEALGLLTRWMASQNWSVPESQPGRTPDTTRIPEAEVNLVLGKLLMFADSSRAWYLADSLVEQYDVERLHLYKEFIGLARRDLGGTKLPTNLADFKYIGVSHGRNLGSRAGGKGTRRN